MDSRAAKDRKLRKNSNCSLWSLRSLAASHSFFNGSQLVTPSYLAGAFGLGGSIWRRETVFRRFANCGVLSFDSRSSGLS